jgi:hypothetical protein
VAQDASPPPQAPGEQTGGAVGPVKVNGTPVSGPDTGTGDDSGGDRNWWPALLILMVVLGLIGLRVLRMRPSGGTDDEPDT